MGKSFQSKSNTLSLKGQKECMDKVFVGRNILSVLRTGRQVISHMSAPLYFQFHNLVGHNNKFFSYS